MRSHPYRWAISTLLLASAAFGQQGRGSIQGVVSDATGAAVPGAAVTIVNIGTNVPFATQTNESGLYVAPTLNVGDYTISVAKAGFKKLVRSGITLQVDQHAQIDLTLDLGDVSQSIEVTAQAALVDTGSATVGKVIENRRVQELPLNGRNALSLVLLTPGVKSQAGPTNSGFGDRGIQLSAISINGGPSALNNLFSMAPTTTRDSSPTSMPTRQWTPFRNSRCKATPCPPSSASPRAAWSTL